MHGVIARNPRRSNTLTGLARAVRKKEREREVNSDRGQICRAARKGRETGRVGSDSRRGHTNNKINKNRDF
ncbi:hypothetical protein QJS04_geneDACA005674 [Acorus gramineus]|uniref:Uncharacterized protein n=1 Tax=Acorus gramineus TaxID=55184 RepID=A0AAV9BJR6_ACOGR|nr:hypothetical protein QJS04_geneDACA005674 [Acorus gramineus]